MSSDLIINRPETPLEIVSLGGMRLHREIWAPLAEEANLKLLPVVHQFVPLEDATVEQLLAEIAVFRPVLIAKYGQSGGGIEYLDQLEVKLRSLRTESCWEASIG